MTAVVEIEVGDEPEAWAAAGFAVDGDHAQVGAVRLRFTGGGGGIHSWGLDLEPPALLDGLPTWAGTPGGQPGDHPNGATVLDHLVLLSPDVGRTVRALATVGLEVRRVRPVPGREPRVQVFLRAGEVMVELVGPERPAGAGPARFYGLAFTVADLGAAAAQLGERLSGARTAVQPGRRIATLRHESLGITVPVAFLSERVRDGTERSEARRA